MLPPPNRSNTCAIVVTYNPDGAFASRLDEVARTATSIVIVDNGSSPAAIAMLRGLDRSDVRLIENSENLGVATAVNQGVRAAAAFGYAWAVAFDQDSIPLPNFTIANADAYAAFPEKEKLAIIVANHIRISDG